MTTTACTTVQHWIDSLKQIGVPKELINTELVESLQRTMVNPDTMTDDAFQGIFTADSPLEAGMVYTSQAAALHSGQHFLLECINWRMAWAKLSIMERSSVHPTADLKKWLIMLHERNLG
jgi:hypothetical protein